MHTVKAIKGFSVVIFAIFTLYVTYTARLFPRTLPPVARLRQVALFLLPHCYCMDNQPHLKESA
jgi:hypothetical protein